MNWKELIRQYKAHIAYVIIALVFLLVLLGIFGALKFYKKPFSKINELPKLIVQESQELNLMEGKSAIELGLAEAKKWQADAELSYVLSTDAGQLRGRSNNWNLIFVSENMKGTGYQVKIADGKISETKEIVYVGSASEFPKDAISQSEAVAQVRAMKGYENVKILSVGMIYGEAVKTWYWGVKTERGTVTIKANK
jgi:hypothetical protein